MLGEKYQIKSAKNLENKKEEKFICLSILKILERRDYVHFIILKWK